MQWAVGSSQPEGLKTSAYHLGLALPTAYCILPPAYCILPPAYFFSRILQTTNHSFRLSASRSELDCVLCRPDRSHFCKVLPGSRSGVGKEKTRGPRHGFDSTRAGRRVRQDSGDTRPARFFHSSRDLRRASWTDTEGTRRNEWYRGAPRLHSRRVG